MASPINHFFVTQTVVALKVFILISLTTIYILANMLQTVGDGSYKVRLYTVIPMPGIALLLPSTPLRQLKVINGIKLYVNGEQITTLYPGFNTYPSQNLDIQFNNTSLHGIGRMGANTSSTYHFDGLMAEFHFVDGAAKAATDFGGIHADTGVWSPIEYTGSHNVGSGVNGFYLDFSDNCSNAALGYDAAGSNNWTVNNIIGPSGVDPTVPLQALVGIQMRGSVSI